MKIYNFENIDMVITNLTKEETTEWYNKQYDTEIKSKDVKEVDYHKGFWNPLSYKETEEMNNKCQYKRISETREINNPKQGQIAEQYGDLYKFTTYKQALELYKDEEKPFVLCSTEF
ncbi:MAG: hypothetical protein HFJ47_00035 [Clostridia bacterium]|nr:hypothetical protein [Clostridia bacterium]